MTDKTNWQHIVQHINQTLNRQYCYVSSQSIGGGCINSAYKLYCEETQHTTQQAYFVKLNDRRYLNMFAAEYDALLELQKCTALKSPKPVCYGESGQRVYLVMQYIQLRGSGDDYAFGAQLAAMHRISADNFGWHRDNTIGSTPQSNQQHTSWAVFWKQQRLIPQLELLYQKGFQTLLQPLANKLLMRLDDFFAAHQPQPSLLHGDLWSGNYGFDEDGHAVIFDPALYYGDRETDLAMTELFGGFSRQFYQGYQDSWPLDDNYQQRKLLYNLYHILNHANLFGGSYTTQAASMMEQLVV